MLALNLTQNSVHGLRLTEIWIYPIKSLGGMRLKKSRVLEKGLEFDRRWMLVDEYGKFLTQRVFPEMALFKLKIDNDQLSIVHVKKNAQHNIDLYPRQVTQQQEVVIWDDTVKAFEVSTETSHWFSDLLGQPCKLVYFPEDNGRPVDRQFATHEHVSLADGYPYLIIGQASLDDLNSRMDVTLPMNRFRPNLVFSGGTPYEEDGWKEFTIGSNRFLGVKPCSRCVLTTVDQETADRGVEPLKTLANYRKRDNKIYFGQNVLAVDHGAINEGDAIVVGNR